ncbi:transcriptional regulator [Sesbania bispinosa]|nr:transcriptional regulator [Sesbania bispinosa]
MDKAFFIGEEAVKKLRRSYEEATKICSVPSPQWHKRALIKEKGSGRMKLATMVSQMKAL